MKYKLFEKRKTLFNENYEIIYCSDYELYDIKFENGYVMNNLESKIIDSNNFRSSPFVKRNFNRYLTEDILANEMQFIFPGFTFERNKYFNHSGIKFKPDLFCKDLDLIIEFNGFRHYNQESVIQKDKIKKTICEEIGYSFIEIPYFVQLTTKYLEYLFETFPNFNLSNDINYTYKHGFIDEKALLPIDFNRSGYERYLKELNVLPISIKEDILKSLEIKSKEFNYPIF